MAFSASPVDEETGRLTRRASASRAGALKSGSGLAAAVGIVLAAVLTGLGWNYASEREFERNREEFAAVARDSELALEHRMDTYRTALDGAAALFIARDEVTFPEWEDYVSTLDLDHSLKGMNGIGFIRPVKNGKQDTFLRRARDRGTPIQAIHPATGHDELFPIKYITPVEGNRPAIGLDLSFETNRRTALVNSRQSGEMLLTGPIELVQDSEGGVGFLLVRPVYRNGAATQTKAQRLRAFEGWSYAPLLARNFLSGLTAREGTAFSMAIYQGRAADNDNLIYRTDAPEMTTHRSRFTRVAHLDVAGQPWTIEWRSLPAFEQTVRSNESLIVLLSGIAISLCLGALLISVVRREGQVRRKVAEATRELAERDAERSIMLEDLRRARDASLAAAKAKSTFLANMSHELRTPMNGVLGFADLLVHSDLKPDARRHAELIAQSGRVMARLLDDILDLSRIEAGKMVISSDPFDIREVCQHVMRLVEPAARDKGLDLECCIADGIPHYVIGDKLRIQQILINLVGNAVKFTDRGYVRLSLAENEGSLVCEVRDSGIGIAPGKLEAIFDDFVQAEDGASRSRGGTGLGLAISRKLAQAMNGSLEGKSTKGAGSTFSLAIPLRKAAYQPETTVGEVVTALPGKPVVDADRPVLMAEDNEINRLLMEAMASDLGITLDCAMDGKEAVAMAEHAALNGVPYALVLMDMQMPVMDGIEATRVLREKGFTPKDLPIVALTANAFAEDITRCLEAGMQEHCAKPLTIGKFRQVLDRWLPGAGGAAAQAAA